MTKFVILSQTLSFIAIERSKSDIILCQIMTKFVVFLTLKGLNDKVGPRDVVPCTGFPSDLAYGMWEAALVVVLLSRTRMGNI